MREPIPFGDFLIRPANLPQDIPAIQRCWRECGWVDESDESYVVDFYNGSQTVVAALDGNVECAAVVAPGAMRYQDDDLDLAAITGVVTSHIARKRGLALAVTAQSIAESANSGADVAALGMFEQGFYDKLGFGSTAYDHIVAFDPSDLRKQGEFRVPQRLTKDDWQAIYRAMTSRWMGHGGCVLFPPEIVKAELGWKKNGMGLGYVDDVGELSHFFFGKLVDEYGPLKIAAIAYQNGEQLMELLQLIRSLGDQVSIIELIEPPHVQLQDLLQQPFRFRRLSRGSDFENSHRACACSQFRILNLEQCMSKTHLYGADLEFNLVLTDPISEYLDMARDGWAGLAGEYTVTLDEISTVRSGTSSNLKTLHASVNAFSRLWFGVRPATHLAISDQLCGPIGLLEELDDALRLPKATWGWGF